MPPDTKERILDSAELLFASEGVANTSLRVLTDHAGVNLASVNYHFQSKDALVQAVLYRRLNPINEKRIALLALAGVDLHKILDAFYRPAVDAVLDSAEQGRPIAALVGRIYSEPGELLSSQVRALMSDVFQRFFAAFQSALPNVPPDALFWRMHFCVGLMAHTFGALHLIEGMARGRVRIDDREEILRQMIAYAAGGLKADGGSQCASS
ncbi:MAG: TetR/AcrR family transcriptional regulator [Acidobacteria bacterium]|nr:TetR/AcrR family transcriptional regulator [Acidobacteriota bacterium]